MGRLVYILLIWVILSNVAASQDVSDIRIGASFNAKVNYSNKAELNKNSLLPNVDISLLSCNIEYMLSIGEYSAIKVTYNAQNVYCRIQYEISTKALTQGEFMQHGFGFGAGWNKHFKGNNVRLSIGALLSYLYVDHKTTQLVFVPLNIGISVKM